jgi:hypothetical protein
VRSAMIHSLEMFPLIFILLIDLDTDLTMAKLSRSINNSRDIVLS